eukprot:jgi/Hompol1/247/HPOL_000396-RA
MAAALTNATGILYRIASSNDLQAFVSSAPTGPQYTAVMPLSLLTIDNVNAMRNTGKLAGILLIKDANSTAPDQYSIDSACPNCNYGLYANDPQQYNWNPAGNNLLYAALDFPIFGIYPSNRRYSQNIAAINEALDFNIKKGYAGNPVYAMQFDALMFAAPIVFVTSKFDSVSFIHDFSFGAARKSGLVAM